MGEVEESPNGREVAEKKDGPRLMKRAEREALAHSQFMARSNDRSSGTDH